VKSKDFEVVSWMNVKCWRQTLITDSFISSLFTDAFRVTQNT
jgi:hypothetical protein